MRGKLKWENQYACPGQTTVENIPVIAKQVPGKRSKMKSMASNKHLNRNHAQKASSKIKSYVQMLQVKAGFRNPMVISYQQELSRRNRKAGVTKENSRKENGPKKKRLSSKSVTCDLPVNFREGRPKSFLHHRPESMIETHSIWSFKNAASKIKHRVLQRRKHLFSREERDENHNRCSIQWIGLITSDNCINS